MSNLGTLLEEKFEQEFQEKCKKRVAQESVKELSSLRDEFAGLAMQSLMQIYWENVTDYPDAASLIKCQVETAYEYADAMLKQRSLTND